MRSRSHTNKERHVVEIPDDVLEEAESVISDIETRMTALVLCAEKRWSPTDDPNSINEDEAPVFGDSEFNEFLKTVEILASHAWYQRIALFLGIDKSIVNETMVSRMATPTQFEKQKSHGFVVKRQTKNGQR